MILGSSKKNILRGLDILETWNAQALLFVHYSCPLPAVNAICSPARKFMRVLNIFYSKHYLRLIRRTWQTAAGIEGHSPAGGCFLTISCDSRVMTIGLDLIGLNETIIAPFWFSDAFLNMIGHRNSEKLLGLGIQKLTPKRYYAST